MARRVWQERELGILESLAAAEERDEPELRWDELLEHTELRPVQLSMGLRALYDDGFITGHDVSSQGSIWTLDWVRLLGPGRVASGQWPAEDGYVALLEALEERIASATGEERTRLERARDALKDLGTKVGTSVLVDVIKRLPEILG